MTFDLSEYITELSELVNIDCGSHNPEGVARIAHILAAKFEAMNWQVNWHQPDHPNAGPCLHLTNKPDAQHYDVMLCGHMDTVFEPGIAEKRPFRTDNKRAYGPGVADMKCGVLSAIYALRALPEQTLDKLAICVAFNCDEEISSVYSRPWIEGLAKRSRMALVCESARPNGELVKARKGNARYELTFHGKAVHSGANFQDGVSAVNEFCHWNLAINQMVNLDKGTTLNVGLVHGGIADNVVPDKLTAGLDVRVWDHEALTSIHRKLMSMAENPFISGATVEVKRTAYIPPMQPTADSKILMQLVEQAATELGVHFDWTEAGGCSDANNIANVGTPALDGLGPIAGGWHSPQEFLVLDSIEPRLKLLIRILEKLAH